MVEETKFMHEVSTFWNEIPVIHLLPTIIEVTSYMSRWGKSFFHKFREKIKSLKTKLDFMVNQEDDLSVIEYLSERGNLNTLLFQEEMYWKQRAKVFWLREGDDNNRFFHASATERKKQIR